MTNSTFEKTVHEKLNAGAANSLSFHWENKDCYAFWLKQSLEYVTQSTRILSLTAGMLPSRLDAISQRFMAHAGEEKGHEKLLIHDIQQIGLTVDKIPLLAEAEAFHKSLYYWIFKGDALVILGWILALEGLAVKAGKEIAARCIQSHGQKASSFLRVHAGEDEDHLSKALSACKVLSDADLTSVEHGIDLYLKLYTLILKGIEGEASKKRQDIAA